MVFNKVITQLVPIFETVRLSLPLPPTDFATAYITEPLNAWFKVQIQACIAFLLADQLAGNPEANRAAP